MRRQSSTSRLERRAKNGRAARRRAPRDYVFLLFMLLTPVVLLLLLAPPDEPVAPASTAAPPPPLRRATPPKQTEDPRRHRDAALPPAYGATPKIVGLETCAAFRAATDERRRPGVAGLFNTGTNLLYGLLRANCILPRECARDGDVAKRTLPWEDHRDCKNLNPNIDFCTADVADEMAWQKLGSKHNCTPALFQVPWGKHNPPEWRGQHYGQTASASMVYQAFGERREDQILPVVVVKDPLTWLQSMCRVSYASEFGRYRMAQCCPHPLVNTKTSTGFNNKRSDGVWRSSSLAHLWSRWNAAYYTSTLPRLMVRYEDLLFRGEETTSQICECVGGTMTSVFNPIDVAAKAGAGHGGGGHQGSGRQEQLEKLGNITRRYGLLDGGDLRVLDRDLDPALVKAFHYGYDHRDASQGQCAPDEGQYLRSLKLKKMGSRTVPLDDENDGIVVVCAETNATFCPRGRAGATA